ncbi:MAG: DUF3108 domain-containing protein [Flavobacteriales bacterium]
MRFRIKLAFLFLILIQCLSTERALSQGNRFASGEKLTYAVYYYLMGVWVPAGEVSFSVRDTLYKGKDCFRFQGSGKTHKRYDWFYKVRDVYQAISDKDDLKPYLFKRNVNEGDFYFYEDCLFDHKHESIYSVSKVKQEPVVVDTSELMVNSFDVLTMIYYARNLDFSKYQIDQKIPIRMFIDGETFDLYIRYNGVENYDHDQLGEIECYTFSPLLVKGTLFKEGERMKVYVTKDSNQIPVYVDSEIRVGSIRAQLTDFEGLSKSFGE